ncbi:MAG: methyl-accepting chemotaxis protein [Halomonadaceae bacterium]|jgi:methyl-accepting chemotaxis protein
MKIRTKIWMLPLSTALIFLVGISLSYLVGSNTSASVDRLRDVDNPYMLEINQIDRHIDAFRTQLQAAAAEGDIDALGQVEALSEQVSRHIRNVSAIAGKEALARQLGDAFEAYQSAAIGATRAMLGVGDLGNLIGEMQAAQTVLLELVEAEMANAMQATLDRQAEASQGITTALLVNLLTGLVVLLVLGLASYLVINAVWRELGDEPDTLRKAMKRVTEGDLSTELKVRENDRESLNASVQQMVVTLRGIIGQIRESTESISLASSEIATGNHDLSARTETTADNLQRTAAATEQLTVTVGQTADSARQADQLASAATSAAARGGAIVEQVVANMSEIEASSQKITEIIAVIDGIAFQTNILALNASVEAARAGEHGRGFAVVAGEVQLLARRSAEAASEIKALIGSSSEKVVSGTRLVRDTGEAMEEIVTGVQRVTDIIGEISAATSEQSSGLTSVNESVATLDDMTQQNAALVEESATAAASLSDQAEKLSQVVAAFRLAQTTAASPRFSSASQPAWESVDVDPRPSSGRVLVPSA